MGKIFCIMGKSATGKDTIYKALLAREDLGFRRIVSCTTRPIRAGEADGVEYHFCTEEERDRLLASGRVIEMRSYDTCEGRWDYFTVADDRIDLSAGDYLIIGTLESYCKIRDFYGKSRWFPFISRWRMDCGCPGLWSGSGGSSTRNTGRCVAAFWRTSRIFPRRSLRRRRSTGALSTRRRTERRRRSLPISCPFAGHHREEDREEAAGLEEQEKKTFSAIVGLEDLKEHLQNAISMDKISHAYIINGEKDSGKMMLAEAFAATLLCEQKGKDACMECRSCRQAAGRNNPDIIYITHEKPNVISVDDIRRQLNDSVVIRPYAVARKVYIVDEAEKMNPQAQNALLKTIEEPPSYVVILLLTTNADGFLPTILSRCVTLNVKPVSAGKIEKMLMERCHVVDYQAKMCAAFSQGNVGKAIRLASSEEFGQRKNAVVELLATLPQMGLAEIQNTVKDLDKEKREIEEYLDLITLWYRDVLLYKSAGPRSPLVFQDQLFRLKSQAADLSYRKLERILEEIDTAKRRLRANVNFELTMELLFMTIKGDVA